MPIHLGRDSKGPFVQWGHQKKYHYKANDKQSLANAKSRAKKQMKAIFSSGYVGQDVQDSNNLIQQIKNKLLKIFHKNTWENFINSQKYGDCQKIANYVAQLFPNIQIIELIEYFAEDAVKALIKIGDNGVMSGTHYLNRINGKLYDFGKGANCISNIYLVGTPQQKFQVTLEKNQLSCFEHLQQRPVFPKYKLKKQNLPQYLYHATYRPLLRKIKQLGLGNTKRTYWEDSVPGVVYLADDPDVAESYADANENLRNEDWLDQIIIFKINTKLLNKSKLFIDNNVKLDQDEQNHTWQYHGIIPFQCLELMNNNIPNQYQNYKFKYFGNCINTVDVDHMWDATQMQQFVDSCKQIYLNDVINNIQSGDRKIPIKLLKHIQTNPQEIDVAIDDWEQNIMFIYDNIDDIHYFFDIKKTGNIYQSKFDILFQQIMNAVQYHVQQVNNYQMGQIIASHQIHNQNPNVDNDLPNLKKLLFDDEMQWYLLKDQQNQICACVAGKLEEYHTFYINEFFSFRKGCGSILLLNILNDHKFTMVYLHSDWTQKQSLNDYYRNPKFQLSEKIVARNGYMVHYFYKNNLLPDDVLAEFIQNEMI